MKKKLIASVIALGMAAAALAAPVSAAGWQKNSAGWWYENLDGSYPKNETKEIKGICYLFDGSGYLKSGWVKQGETWYYYQGGLPKSGWLQDNGYWYYLAENGGMQTGFLTLEDGMYNLGDDGKMRTGELSYGGGLLNFGEDGRLRVADYTYQPAKSIFSYPLPEGWTNVNFGSADCLFPPAETEVQAGVILMSMELNGAVAMEALTKNLSKAKRYMTEQLTELYPDAKKVQVTAKRMAKAQGDGVTFHITMEKDGVSLNMDIWMVFFETHVIQVVYTGMNDGYQNYFADVQKIAENICFAEAA